MSKILLKNDAHILQMLGNFDHGHSYALPKDIAEILIKMPKTPVVSKDEIDVGSNVAFLKSDSGIDFCLEDGTLFLVERATEMGGLVAYTYLTPLTEITLDYFKSIDPNIDLTPIKDRIAARRTKQQKIMAEHERLARTAMNRAQKILNHQPIDQFDQSKSTAKRFIRPGKPDYNTSQLQLLAHTIDKNDLLHPATEIINRWKNACNNKTSAALLSEAPSGLHFPVIASNAKQSRPKQKTLDFKSILAAMLKQDKPRKPPTRIKPSEKVAEILNAETEIETEFEADPIKETTDAHEFADEEKELHKLVTSIIGQIDTSKQTQAQTQIKTSLKGKKQDLQVPLAPASSNHDHER